LAIERPVPEWQPPSRRARPADVLNAAAQEFDARAQLPGYLPRDAERIKACAQWLRDMAADCPP
jgi:hypothetical protein